MYISAHDIPTIVVTTAFLFGLLLVLRHLLFFGFSPFLPHRPEVIERILKELDPGQNGVFYSLGYGRSGFLPLAQQKWPQGEFFGVDDSFIGVLLSRLQLFLQRKKIKVLHNTYYKAKLHRANVVYCYLNPEDLRDMYKKLKLEPRTDAMVISAGFLIPYLDPVKVIKTEPKKRWYGFLAGHKKVLTIKEKEHTRDENIYFYQV